MKKITVGDLIKVLSEVRPDMQVVLNACIGSFDEKMKSPWDENFRCHLSTRGGKHTQLVISGVF